LTPPSDLYRAQYYLSLADALARQTLQPQFAATNRWMQGKIALLQGQIERAETYFLDAIQLGKDTGVYSAVLAGNAGLIRTYSRAGFGDLADARIDTTLSYLETHGQLCFDSYTDAYWDLYKDLFGPAIQALSMSGSLSTIFDAFEKYKALKHQRSVFQLKYRQDALGVNSTQTPLDLDDDLIGEKWKNIWELWKGDKGDNSTEVQNVRDEIRQAFGLRKKKRLSVGDADPLLASLSTPLTESIYTLREKLQTTGDVFLHYLVGDESTSILLVRADSVFFKNAHVGKQELLTWVQQISPAYSRRNDASASHTLPSFRVDAADTLYRLIFEPVSMWIPEKSNLVISPDDVLSTLPFECLVSNSSESTDIYDYRNVRFLVEDFNISYALYASFLCWPAKTQKRRGERIGIFSDLSAEAMRGKLGGIGVGLNDTENCTKARFLSEASRYQILHLATPTTLNGKSPLYSSVAFNDSEDESAELRAHELFGQKHNADLAIHATVYWKPRHSSAEAGIGGLVHAWNYSGVPSIVVNVWSTPSKSSQIMANFYLNLKQGLDKTEALRQAKMTFMNEEDRDPRVWGSYLLYGDTGAISLRTENLTWVIAITIFGSLTLVVVLIRHFVRIRKETRGQSRRAEGS
jgi:CHAT domain-containing protein